MDFFLHLKQLFFGDRLRCLNLYNLYLVYINGFLSKFPFPSGKSLIECHILFLNNLIDLIGFIFVDFSLIVQLILHFFHIFLYFRHNLDLHLYFHVPLLFTHFLGYMSILIVSLFLVVNKVVLSDILFGFFSHLLHL